jgi:hypothetical protein
VPTFPASRDAREQPEQDAPGDSTSLDQRASPEQGPAGSSRPATTDHPAGGENGHGSTQRWDPLAGAGEPAEVDPAEPVVVTSVRARKGPALVFLALVAVVAIGGFAIAIVGSGQKQSGGASLGRLRGVELGARSAAAIVRRIATDGNPPADVTRALVVPADSTVTSARPPGAAVILYSGTVQLSVAHSASQVVTFFKRELVHDHWTVLAVDSTAGGDGTRIFAKIGSSDGFYWEVGVGVTPVTTSITPALSGGSAPASTVSLTVFELDDAD